jgi:hypothetical protein
MHHVQIQLSICILLIRSCLRHLIKHTRGLAKFSGRKQHLVLPCRPLRPRCARRSPAPPLQPHRGRSAAPSCEGAGVARGIPGLQLLQGWPAAGAASPGESDDGLPSEDCEVTRSGLLCLFACMQLLASMLIYLRFVLV